jgi:hypothetical protein
LSRSAPAALFPRRQVFLASPGSYVRDGEALGDLSFATLYQRARARGEVALGVQVRYLVSKKVTRATRLAGCTIPR